MTAKLTITIYAAVDDLLEVNNPVIVCMCCRIVRNVDGSDVVKFEHPAAVRGCDWCPTNKYDCFLYNLIHPRSAEHASFRLV